MQSISKSRLPKIIGIALCVLIALSPKLAAIDDDPTSIDRWITELGAKDWRIRDRATRQLVDAGRAAIGKLEHAREETDQLEVRERVDWLLRRIDPRVFDVRLLRFEIPTTATTPALREWLTTKVVGQLNWSAGRSTDGDTEFDTVRVRIVNEAAPYVASVRIGPTDRESEQVVSLTPGHIAVLRREDWITKETANGNTTLRTTPSIWLIALTDATLTSEPAAVDRDTITEQIRERLAAQLKSEDSNALRQAYRVAAKFGFQDLLRRAPGDQLDTTPLVDRDLELALARFEAGDTRLLADLERWLNEVDRSNEDPRQTRCALLLAGQGSPIGIRQLIERLGEADRWTVHRSLTLFSQRIERGQATPQEAESLFDAMTAPEVFPYLPWDSIGRADLLFQRLLDVVPVDHAAPKVLEILEESATAGNLGLMRGASALRALRHVLDSGATLDDSRWQPIVGGYLDNTQAIGMVFELLRRHPIRDWQPFIEQLSRAYGDGSLVYSLDAAVNRLLHTELDPTLRKQIWLARVAGLRRLTDFNLTRIDGALTAMFGKLDDLPPRSRENTAAWQARAEKWVERIEQYAADGRLATPEADRTLQLVEATLRRDGDTTTLVSFDSTDLVVGRSLFRIDGLGHDRSVLLEAQAGGSLRMNGSNIVLGRPTLRTGGLGNSYQLYTFGRDDFNPRSLRRPGQVTFHSIQVVNDPNASRLDSWADLLAYIVANIDDTNPQQSSLFARILTEPRVGAALPLLRHRYAETKFLQVASVMLSLGDNSGREQLLENLESADAKSKIDIVKALIRNGDPKGIERALMWTHSPPRELRNAPYQLIRELDSYLSNPIAAVDEKVWATAMIRALEGRNLRNQATKILRTLSGEDFAFMNTYRLPRGEQEAAQTQAVARWREWYENKYGPLAPLRGKLKPK